ncbi:helix-turn-helix transcriptional regulator [bacterium]|nr:helix-turn-helix transcriptional regulator [bacterium]
MNKPRLQNRLRERRKAAGGLTQQELAERAGVTRQSIISIEGGKYRPSVELALMLARALGCTVDDLFHLGDDGDQP